MNTPVTKLEVRDGKVVALEAGGERIEPSRGHLVAAAARDGRPVRRGRARRGPGRGPGPALPRLPDDRADHRRRGPVPGQLDLHPRAGRRGRPHPELPLVVARGWSRTSPRPRSAWSTSASRATSCGSPRTRTSSSSASARSSSSAWRRPPRSSAGSSRASRRRTRCTTPTTPSASTSIKRLARGHLEPPAGRPQRPAPVQQLRPLDAHRHARGRERHGRFEA